MTNKLEPSSTGTETLREAIRLVLDYLWEDELRDFLLVADDARAGDEKAKDILDGHIFQAMAFLNSWFCGSKITANDYLVGQRHFVAVFCGKSFG